MTWKFVLGAPLSALRRRWPSLVGSLNYLDSYAMSSGWCVPSDLGKLPEGDDLAQLTFCLEHQDYWAQGLPLFVELSPDWLADEQFVLLFARVFVYGFGCLPAWVRARPEVAMAAFCQHPKQNLRLLPNQR